MKKKITAFVFALCVAPALALGQDKTSVTERNDIVHSDGKSNFEWRHKSDDNGGSLEITMHKKVEFNDDFTEIVRVPAGGYFEVRERRGGTVRWFEARSDAEGRVQRRYTVDGERREFDREAQAWLARVLTDAVRNGLYAEETARRILRERGASAVLDEAANVTGDYARAIFLNVVLERPRPDTRTVERALQLARNFSDYARANLLVAASKSDLGDDRLRAAFFDSLDRIKSDYYIHQVITSAVESHRREAEVLLRAVAATKAISSDYYKAQALLSVAQGASALGAPLRDAVRDAARGISSDYYRNQVLAAVGGGRA